MPKSKKNNHAKSQAAISTSLATSLEPTINDFIKELANFIDLMNTQFQNMEQMGLSSEQLSDFRIHIENITAVLQFAEVNTHLSVETLFSLKIYIKEMGEITCLQALANWVGLHFLEYCYENRNGKFPFRNAITRDNLNAYTNLKDSSIKHSALTMLLLITTHLQMVFNFIINNNLVELFDPNLLTECTYIKDNETHSLSATYITILSLADTFLPWLIENVADKKLLMNNASFLKASLTFPKFNYILMQSEYFNLIEHKTLADNFPDSNLAASIINFMISKTNILSPSNYIIKYDQQTGIYVYFLNYENASESKLRDLTDIFKNFNKQTSSNSLDYLEIVPASVFTIRSSLHTIVNFFNVMKQRLAMIPMVDRELRIDVDVNDELYNELVEEHLIPDLTAFFTKYEQEVKMDAADKEIFGRQSIIITQMLDYLKKLPLKVAFLTIISLGETKYTLAHFFADSTIILFLKMHPRYIQLFNHENLNAYLPFFWNQKYEAPQSPLVRMLIVEGGPQFIAENGLVRFLDPNMFSVICISDDEEVKKYTEELLVKVLIKHAEIEKWFVGNYSELILEKKYLEKYPHLVNYKKILIELLENKEYEFLLRNNLIIKALTNETLFSVDTPSNCTFAELLIRYQLLQNIPAIQNNHYKVSVSETNVSLSFNDLTKKTKSDFVNAVKLFNSSIEKKQALYADCESLTMSSAPPYTISGNFYSVFRFITLSKLTLQEIVDNLIVQPFETKPNSTQQSSLRISPAATKKPKSVVSTAAQRSPKPEKPKGTPVAANIQPKVVKKADKPQPVKSTLPAKAKNASTPKVPRKSQPEKSVVQNQIDAITEQQMSQTKTNTKARKAKKRADVISELNLRTDEIKVVSISDIQTGIIPIASIQAPTVPPVEIQVDTVSKALNTLTLSTPKSAITDQAQKVQSVEIVPTILPQEIIITRHHFFQPLVAQPDASDTEEFLIEFDPTLELAIETLESFFATAEAKPTLRVFGSQVINAVLIKLGLPPMKPNDTDIILIGDAKKIIPFLIKNHFRLNKNNPDFPIWTGYINDKYFEISIKDKDVIDADMTLAALRAERNPRSEPDKKSYVILDPTKSAKEAIRKREIELCSKTPSSYLLSNSACLFRIIRYHLDGFTIHPYLLNVIKNLKISFETISQKDFDHIKAIIRKNINFGDAILFISKMIELGLLKKILNINVQTDNIDWPKLSDHISERVKKVFFYPVDSQENYAFITYPPPMFDCNVKLQNGNTYITDLFNNTYRLDEKARPLLLDQYGETDCPFMIICDYGNGATNYIRDQFGMTYSLDHLARPIYFDPYSHQVYIVQAIQIPRVQRLSQSYIQDVYFLQDNNQNYYVGAPEGLYRVTQFGTLSKVDKFYNDEGENVPQIRVSANIRFNLFSLYFNRHLQYLAKFDITIPNNAISCPN